MKALPYLAIGTAVVLTGCSGDSIDVPTQIVVEPPPAPATPEPPTVQGARVIEGPLALSADNGFARYLKNGIYGAAEGTTVSRFAEALAATSSVAGDASGGNFSSTNTQELGVDEADRVEYNGSELFLSTYPEWFVRSETQPEVRIYNRQSDDSLEVLSNVTLQGGEVPIAGMYQANQRLTLIGASSPMIPLNAISIQPWQPFSDKVTVGIFDTSDTSTPVSLSEFSIDGWLIASRRIGNELYLVTSFTPSIEGLIFLPADDESKVANYDLITSTPTEELMPRFYQGNESRLLNQPEECLLPQAAEENDGYGQVLTVVRVNLTAPEDIDASCMGAMAEVAYVSANNLYLTGSTADEETVIHRVALDESLTYQASGIVPGVLGWRGNPQFRLSEQNDVLRIVSSDYRETEPQHFLHVLEQQGEELSVVASLPNETNPEPIGKPGEDIFAVRYLGDKAYVVTFERIDPLYVIDISTPSAPMIEGSLEIPGFSSYLHPIGENLLLGVGQEIPAETSDDPLRLPGPAPSEGMKVSLFDVSNPQEPTELATVVKPSSFTPVEFDYRALSTIEVDGVYRFAMPMESFPSSDNSGMTVYEPTFSLLMLEVDSGSGSLTEMGEMQVDTETEDFVFGGNDRSVLHDERVYYIHGNHIWLGQWGSSETLAGPF